MKNVMMITLLCVMLAAYVAGAMARGNVRKYPLVTPCFDNQGKWYTR